MFLVIFVIKKSHLVTAPVFDKVKWRTSSGKILSLTKPGKSRAITSIKVNGKEHDGYFVLHNLFTNGGKIDIITK